MIAVLAVSAAAVTAFGVVAFLGAVAVLAVRATDFDPVA